MSDSEYIRRVMPPQSPGEGDLNDGEMREENDDDAFAAAIEQALQEGSDEDDEDDEDDEEDEEIEGEEEGEGEEDGISESGSGSVSGSGSDDDEDDEEYSGAKKLLDDEIKQLQVAIAKKNEDIAKVTNVALKVSLLSRSPCVPPSGSCPTTSFRLGSSMPWPKCLPILRASSLIATSCWQSTVPRGSGNRKMEKIPWKKTKREAMSCLGKPWTWHNQGEVYCLS